MLVWTVEGPCVLRILLMEMVVLVKIVRSKWRGAQRKILIFETSMGVFEPFIGGTNNRYGWPVTLKASYQ